MVFATLAVLAGSALPAAAFLPPSVPPPPQHWSFSAQNWLNRTGVFSDDEISSSYNLSLAFSATYNILATNTSRTTTEAEGVRMLSESLHLVQCTPNCSFPVASQDLRANGWLREVQFLNLTSTANVFAGGVRDSALGARDASLRTTSGLKATTSWSAGAASGTRWQNDSTLSEIAIGYSPALGLIPWNAPSVHEWNATSPYVAIGGWNDSFGSASSSHGLSRSDTLLSSGSINQTGSQSVEGENAGNHTLPSNQTITSIELETRGPVEFNNLLFRTLIGSDLFLGGAANWTLRTENGHCGDPFSQMGWRDDSEPNWVARSEGSSDSDSGSGDHGHDGGSSGDHSNDSAPSGSGSDSRAPTTQGTDLLAWAGGFFGGSLLGRLIALGAGVVLVGVTFGPNGLRRRVRPPS